jgi:ribosome production factor 1
LFERGEGWCVTVWELQVQNTIEAMRAADDTMVDPEDTEVAADEAEDEFAGIFGGGERPRTLITTKIQPSAHIYPFVRELLMVFPGSVFYRRARFPLKRICEFAAARGFTHLMVVGEKGKEVASLLVVKLPDGPTALFRVTSARLGAEITGHGNPTGHRPEVILNNFSTRLGHRIGRMLGSLFPYDPEFRGRQVVTFHNQRDFVFVRHHRYIFTEKGKRASLQEIGPRLTLRLKWLLQGTFDTRLGDFEFFHRGRQLGTGRKRFHL